MSPYKYFQNQVSLFCVTFIFSLITLLTSDPDSSSEDISYPSVIFSTGEELGIAGTKATNFFNANLSYQMFLHVLARSMTSSMRTLLSVFLTMICYDIRLKWDCRACQMLFKVFIISYLCFYSSCIRKIGTSNAVFFWVATRSRRMSMFIFQYLKSAECLRASSITNLRGFDLLSLICTYVLCDLNRCRRSNRRGFLSIQFRGRQGSIFHPNANLIYCNGGSLVEPWLLSSKIVYNTNQYRKEQ